MPSGKQHNSIDQSFLITVFVILVYTNEIDKYKIILLGYLIGSLYFSPDLDTNRTKSDSNYGIYEIFWNLYSKLFSHQGISHNLIFGTFTRLIYFCILFSPLIYINYVVILQHKEFFIKIIIGIYIANIIHLISDKMFNKKKLKLFK